MTYAPEVDPYGEKRNTMVSNILAIAAFLVVAAIVTFGSANLVAKSSGWFSALLKMSGSSVTITAPSAANAGVPFALSWKYSSTDGSYTLLYQCDSGVRLRTPNEIGSENDIPCGAAFMLGTSDSISITPVMSTTSPTADVPISIFFIPNASSTPALGIAVVHVVGASATSSTAIIGTTLPSPVLSATKPTTTASPTQTTPVSYTQTTRTQTSTGIADLTVQIISIYTDSTGLTAATFNISNDGSAPSGSYYFTAQIPTAQGYTYTSPLQVSLDPGAHVTNTLRFSRASQYGAGVFSVTVDPSNAVRESSKSNNTASQTMVTTNAYPSYNTVNSYPSYYAPYPYQYQVSPTYTQQFQY